LVSQIIFQKYFLKEKCGEFEVAACRCTVTANGQCLLGGTRFGLADWCSGPQAYDKAVQLKFQMQKIPSPAAAGWER
jgi:hypothetical protein